MATTKNPATSRATISRTHAKAYVTEIRRSAARVATILDTVASNPEWAEERSGVIDRNLAKALAEIEESVASLRKGLGLR